MLIRWGTRPRDQGSQCGEVALQTPADHISARKKEKKDDFTNSKWHFYGTPPGLIGVLFPGFLGWLLAKSMVETRGFLMAWLIQLPLDILVFGFWVIGNLAAAG